MSPARNGSPASEPGERLAIFTSCMRGAGGQRSMLNLASGIARRGVPLDLVLAQAEGPLLVDVPPEVRVIDLRASRVLASMPALMRYLRRERPAAMLSALGYVNIVALWAHRLTGVPTRLYLNEQNTVSQELPASSRWRMRQVPQLMRRFYPWADGIVCVSAGVADDLAELLDLPRDRVDVIYNPSVVRADIVERAAAPLDHPWFRDGEPPVLVGVGRLEPQKDFPNLLRAFARVREHRRVRLLILGEGRRRLELEALVRELGLEDDVSLPGFVQNPHAYVARSALFVLSSGWEGLPTVLVEALCCGTPVVATDCPSGPREILRGGKYGPLVPVGDTTALAQAIDQTLQAGAPSPPDESWLPFELDSIVDRYLDLLAPGGERTADPPRPSAS